MVAVKTKTAINWKEILERTEKYSYNLYDLVPMSVDNIEKIENDVVDVEVINDDNEFIDLKNKYKTMKSILEDVENKYNVIDPNAERYLDKIGKIYNEKREEYFKQNLDLPQEAIFSIDEKNMEETEDLLTLAVLAPRAKVKDIKKIADALGFMIMPWQIHNRKSFENESYELQQSIKKFEELEKYCDLYVVSPLIYWDIKAHIEAENPNFEIYASKKIKDVVSSVEIQLPILRQFNFKLKEHDERISNLEIDMDKAFESINELEDKFEKIQSEISELWKEVAEQRKEIQEAQRLARSAMSKAERAIDLAVRPVDPMLFAVKKGSKLDDKDIAIIGPVWGPDFSWLVPAVENIKPQIGQREIIEEINPFLIASKEEDEFYI